MRETPDIVVIELRGTLDVFLAGRFADAALHCVTKDKDTSLDCAGLERMDGSALQVVLALRQALVAQAHELRVSNVPASVASYLALAGLSGLTGSHPEPSNPATLPEAQRATASATRKEARSPA